MVLNEAYNGPIMNYKDQKEWEVLNKKLENMEYGILMPGYEVIPPLNKRNYNTTEEDWDKYWRLATPEQFVKQNGGVCWDYVAYKAAWLDNKKIKYNAYYMEFNNGATHTIITIPIFYNSSKIEYWENSIDYLNGPYYCDTLYEVLELIVDTIGKKEKFNLKIKSLYEYYPNEEMYGLNSAEYIAYIKKYGKKMNLSQLESTINEACKDVNTARKFVNDVGKLAKKYDANYFIVTDGASGTKNDGNEAVKFARDNHIKWEKNHGFDPYEDWSGTIESVINESTLSNYKKIPLNKENINKYKKDYPALKHIRDNNDGYLFIDNDKLVAVVAVENKEDGSKWGTALEIFNPYKGKRLSYKLLDIATKDLSIEYLSVRKTNKLAIHIYEKYGFKSYKETDSQFFMKYNKNLKESTDMINENMLLNRKDIEYNYDKFINGEINYAIIVGFSGSGKSTLGRKLSSDNSIIEHYELDDVVTNWNFSDDNLKEYGDLIYSFFKGSGKKYRISYQYLVDNNIDEDHYERPLLKDFVDYTKKYAKSHKAKRFIIEGIWPLIFNHNPEYYKDWCVMIKGTSYLISDYRANKRDISDDPNYWFGKEIINFIKSQRPSRLKKVAIPMNKAVDKWYKYFNSIITESNDMNAIYKLKVQPVIEWNYIDAPFFTEQEIVSILNERYHRDHYNHASDYHRADPSTYRNRVKEIQTLIKNTEDPEEITRLKMELIKLGWNPEVEVTESNISKAKNRVIRLYTEEMNNTCDIIDYSGNYDLYESYASSLGGKDKFLYIVLEDNCAMIYKYNNEIMTNSSRVYSVYDEANQLQKQDYNPMVYNTLNSTLFPMGDDYRAMNVAKDLIKENNNGKFILNKLG